MLRFFEHGGGQSLVDRLAAADRLTVFVGAGAGMEVGLPSWEQLVTALLDDTIAEQGWGDDREALLERGRTKGALLTAEVVEALTTGSLGDRIKPRLYGDVKPADLRPGPLPRAVAELAACCGDDLRILTTNYDELVEGALRLRRQPPWRRVASYVTNRRPPQGTVAVVHLHGLVGVESRGQVVLTEGDYARMRTQAWQERCVVDALNETTCLFIGASLTDANLVGYLHRARADERHVAVWRRRPSNDPATASADSRWSHAEAARWQRLGITPAWADNYADIAQFVHELSMRRGTPTDYRPFGQRLRDWMADERDNGVLYTADARLFRDIQEFLQEQLDLLVSEFRDLAGIPSDEATACALWCLNPPRPDGPWAGQERALIVGNSDRVMTDPATLEPIGVEPSSRWAGVRALTAGLPVGVPVNSYASRWRYVRAVPIFLPEPRMPLGALTVSSVREEGVSALSRIGDRERTELDEWLVGQALGVLSSSHADGG